MPLNSLESGASWCNLGVESGIFRPILAYLVNLGKIIDFAVSCCFERNYANGRYRIRTCDLTGVIRAL